MAQPIYRLSISNKDKSERTYTDYKGNEKTSRYQSIGAVFKNEDGRLSCAIDKKVTIDPDKHWLNFYVVEQDDEDEKPKSKKGKPATKVKKTKKAPPPADDEDDENPFADDEE